MLSAPYSSKRKQWSLASILERDGPKSKWNGDRLSDKYRDIIRFVLQELFKHDNDLGYLNPKYIFLTSGEAKIHLPRDNKNVPPLFRKEFISLVIDMLGTGHNPKRLELKHFINMASERVTFGKLFHHPLLQSPTERCNFPIRVNLHLNDNQGTSWKKDYGNFKSGEIDINSQIQKSIYKDGLISVLDWKPEGYQNLDWKPKGYQNSVVGVLDFSKNVTNHINQHLERLNKKSMRDEEIEKELTKLFPTRLIDLYGFLADKNISMDFLSK